MEQPFEEQELGKYDDYLTTAKATMMTICRGLFTDDHHHVLDELYPRQDEDWSDVEIFYNIDLVFLSKPSQYQKTTPPAAEPGIRSYVLQHTYRQSHHTLKALKYMRTMLLVISAGVLG